MSLLGDAADAIGGSAIGQAVAGPVGSVAGAVGGGLSSGLGDVFGSGAGAPNVNFDPRNVNGLLGSTTFDDEGNANVSGSPELQSAVNGLFGSGEALLSQGQETATQDFSGLRDESLSTLRELARPEEEQAAASTASRLFNQGILGSTGGALQMQGLEEAQAQADLQRQMQAINLANQQQQRGLQQMQAGQGLLGQAGQLGQAPLQTANVGMNIGAKQMEAQGMTGQMEEQRRAGNRQFASNLIGSAAQVGGSAMMPS